MSAQRHHVDADPGRGRLTPARPPGQPGGRIGSNRMRHIAIFNLLQILASAYAFTRGGVPERLAGTFLLVAAVATRLAFLSEITPYVSVDTSIVVVDLCLLAVLVALALYADRFWPIWMAALQALGATAHLVRVVEPSVVSMAYVILVAVWSYPMVLILAAATLRHRRRLKQAGSDLDWSVR